MKKVVLIRHAKAVHDTSYSDFERPLKPSGIRDATLMAERLSGDGIIPQLLVTSPAIRTQATADIFSEHLSIPKPIADNNIYEGSQRDLLHVINEFDDKYDFIGLVGHNPGISQMLYNFTGFDHDVPPGTVALITFGFDEWKLLSHDTGKIEWFGTPKDD
ncbi:MAG: histidine phosphatase family protein [Mucilaginibacter sp.]